MFKVRKMLTEILLDVTNQETEAVAKEVYYKAKNKVAKGSLKTQCYFLKEPLRAMNTEWHKSPTVADCRVHPCKLYTKLYQFFKETVT